MVCPVVTGVPRQWNPLPGHPISFRVVHTTGGVISRCRRLAKCPCPSTTVRDSCATLCHSGETSMYLHSPYVPVLDQKTTKAQPYVHRNLLGHIFDYRSKKFTCACTKLSAHGHMVLNSEAEILNIILKLS